jgi:recombination protein RecT
MENKQVTKTQRPFKDLIGDPKVQERFEKMLGDNATSFLMSVLNCVQNNDKLMEAEPQSILMASAVAGTLNLPIDPNLGQAYIIPYNVKIKEKGKPDRWEKRAQFQIGYKGLIQLGHRSRQFAGLNSSDVREGEFKGVDRMTGEHTFDWIQDNDEREKLPIIGFVGYFKLTNGFAKSMYMTANQMNQHGSKYSKTFSSDFGLWKKDFVGMGKKTVLKLLIDKYAPKSVEMQKAITNDQGVFDGDGSMKYLDNPKNEPVDLEKYYEGQLKEIKELLDLDGISISEDERIHIDRIIDENEVESFKKVVVLLQSRKPKSK